MGTREQEMQEVEALGNTCDQPKVWGKTYLGLARDLRDVCSQLRKRCFDLTLILKSPSPKKAMYWSDVGPYAGSRDPEKGTPEQQMR